MFNKLTNVVRGIAVPSAGVAAMALAGSAMATGPDFSTITAAVDFSSVATAVITVLAAVAGVLIAYKGGKLLLRALA